ncbi:MAG TPA: helix-turn-helix transcriptional regulator [Egibacteraceae bacterium]|nr:helix-turn-helix transcriptional regulator [Egibacteraceae bacterium]
MAADAVYIISVAAELAGVHPQTLRTYERKGLIKPARTAGGTRRYSERDVHRVRLIQDLTQQEGVNLAGVLRILAMQEQIETLESRLERARDHVEHIRSETRRALAEARRSAGSEIVLYRPPGSAVERHPGAVRRRR